MRMKHTCNRNAEWLKAANIMTIIQSAKLNDRKHLLKPTLVQKGLTE